MTGDNKNKEELTAQSLMMAALDGELDEHQLASLMDTIDADPALQAEWIQMQRLKGKLDRVQLRRVPDDTWDDYWGSIYRRIERGVAWILISLGATVVGGIAIWFAAKFIWQLEWPLIAKLGVFALAAGFLILFVSVARERASQIRHDRYKDVER